MVKVVINNQYGGYSLSQKACEALGKEWDGYGYYFSDDRANPNLISVVEQLGEAASGVCSTLKVVEVPDDVDWEIEEYDGNEWVAEKHRTWS